MSLGTRTKDNLQSTAAPSGSNTRSVSRDPGTSRRVSLASGTFSSAGTITGSNNDFSGFVAGENVLVQGTNLNNREFLVSGIDGTNAAYLTLSPPPKDETVAAIVRVV